MSAETAAKVSVENLALSQAEFVTVWHPRSA
jgi:hypothetical protein